MDIKNLKIKDSERYYYTKKILRLSYLFTVINVAIFILLCVFDKSILKIDGIILDLSGSADINILFFVFACQVIISLIFKAIEVVLNEKAYKIIKIILLIMQLIIMLSLFIAVKFFTNYTSYNNGVISVYQNRVLTKIKVSDINYFVVNGKEEHGVHARFRAKGEEYNYMGILVSYYYNGTLNVLEDCDSSGDIPDINKFLEDIEQSHNYQGVYVSKNDDIKNVDGIYEFKIIKNSPSPIFYLDSSFNQFNNIDDSDDTTIASENFFNQYSDKIYYREYINQ